MKHKSLQYPAEAGEIILFLEAILLHAYFIGKTGNRIPSIDGIPEDSLQEAATRLSSLIQGAVNRYTSLFRGEEATLQ